MTFYTTGLAKCPASRACEGGNMMVSYMLVPSRGAWMEKAGASLPGCDSEGLGTQRRVLLHLSWETRSPLLSSCGLHYISERGPVGFGVSCFFKSAFIISYSEPIAHELFSTPLTIHKHKRAPEPRSSGPECSVHINIVNSWEQRTTGVLKEG